MATSVLNGGSIAKFKTIELHKYLKSWKDHRRPRAAEHVFLKRDGALQEPMGREAFRTDWLLTFTGDTWITDFLELAASIDREPIGPLVHPVFGQIQRVLCQGFDAASVDLTQALNTIDVPISFVEATLDARIDLTGYGLPAALSAAMQSRIQSLLADILDYADDALMAAATMINLLSTAFLATASLVDSAGQGSATGSVAGISGPSYPDAVTASTSSAPLVSSASPIGTINLLNSQAAALGEASQTLLAQINSSTSTAVVGAARYSASASVRAIYALALNIVDGVGTGGGSHSIYVVPDRCHVAVLMARLYGGPKAIGMIEGFLSLNQIVNPSEILPGTIVQLAAPPVSQ